MHSIYVLFISTLVINAAIADSHFSYYYVTSSCSDDCSGQPDGLKLADPTDCHGYFVCLNNEKVQQYCAPGEKFMEQIQRCIVGKCPPCNCDGQPPVTPSPPLTPTTPSPPEESTAGGCGGGQTTESTTKSTPGGCTSCNTCSTTPKPPIESTTAGGGCGQTTESTTKSTSGGCSSCSTCGTTPTTSTETTPKSGGCGDETTPSSSTVFPTPGTPKTTPTPVTPAKQTTTAMDPTKPDCSLYPNGERIPNEEHCRYFWQCVADQPVLLYCEEGMWFNRATIVCDLRQNVKNCPAMQD